MTADTDLVGATEAAPCPFCGGIDIYWSDCRSYVAMPDRSKSSRLVCRRCGSGTTSFPPDSLDRCMQLWNTRPNAETKRLRDAGYVLATRLLQIDIDLEDDERVAMEVFLPRRNTNAAESGSTEESP